MKDPSQRGRQPLQQYRPLGTGSGQDQIGVVENPRVHGVGAETIREDLQPDQLFNCPRIHLGAVVGVGACASQLEDGRIGTLVRETLSQQVLGHR